MTTNSQGITNQGSFSQVNEPKQDEKKKKLQDKIYGILEQILTNSSNFLTTFQETTALLKSMDRHMAAILEKL